MADNGASVGQVVVGAAAPHFGLMLMLVITFHVSFVVLDLYYQN